MSFIMQLDLDTLVDLIGKAKEKDLEETIWQKWLVELPNMSDESFIPFDKYLKKHTQANVVNEKSEEEVLQDAEDILKMMSRPK